MKLLTRNVMKLIQTLSKPLLEKIITVKNYLATKATVT